MYLLPCVAISQMVRFITVYHHFQQYTRCIITGYITRLIRRVSLVEQVLLTLPEHLSSPPFLVGFVLLDLQFYVYVFISLFVLLYFFFCPLCCLFFFDIRILITPLVSSNSSCYPFGCIALKTLNGLAFQSFDLRVPDACYSRNVPCALNVLCMLTMLSYCYCKKSYLRKTLNQFSMFMYL